MGKLIPKIKERTLKKLIIFLLTSIYFSGAGLFADGKRYALIIGSDYKGNKSGINELQLCEADAKYIRDQVKKKDVGNFNENDVTVLLGKDVTKENIEREIKALGKKADAKDTVFLFFAGHGFFQRDASAKNGMRNYIVCFDRPHLSDDELNEYLKSIKSPKTVFVFDCCFSGGIAKKGAKTQNTRGDKEIPIPEGSKGTVRQDPEDFFFQNKAILSSSDDNQTSIEIGGTINHGIFTYQFGRAMESADLNGDKVVTALEAFFQTRDNVIKMAQDADHEQVPQVSGDASGIFLSGSPKPEVVPVKPEPAIKPDPKPDPASDPIKPNPVKPVINNDEPPAGGKPGSLLIKTTIIRDRAYGLTSLPPEELMRQKKIRKGDRNVKVFLGGIEFPATITWVKSDFWGAVSRGGKLIPGETCNLLIKSVPAGVYKVTIKADEYPELEASTAVIAGKDNTIDVIASMTGFGAIQGQVFYKTLDNPVIKQPIYMPTVKSINNTQKIYTDDQGRFWFTSLLPGEYEIKPSFLENIPIENSILTIKEGEVTRVQVILNVKLSGTKTKY